MSLKSKEKSVADTGAYEHLVALPNRCGLRNQRATIAYPVFKEAEHAGALGTARLDYD